ncbi:S1/P1 nuclease [Echinicola sp. CAU 1574]|uniref:S1/P1 nuclease n=1 Tax=Echinicola arenosa TaxID=2774144 RepID=A0ABR9AIK8_9BACT|nr:S1/P1 nuclease [Echinicola arenosa]MBD8488638.1 S1/P1 nuclease [Echinicola arenosa]
MKKLFIALFMCTSMIFQSYGWGQNGHRVIGQIAAWHLNSKAQRSIAKILGHESIPMVANWMDQIRSDHDYDYAYTWHFLTVHEGEGYNPAIQEEGGDAYETLQRLIDELKNKPLSLKKKQENLKMLIHIVGDLHQPLHVGTGEDMGGNKVDVYYFNQKTNLHTVWDTKMIERQHLSFTELATHLNNRADKQTIKELQGAPLSAWLEEAVSLRPFVYDLPENKRLSYEYDYKYFPIIEARLLAGGIRLAGILNDIYG